MVSLFISTERQGVLFCAVFFNIILYDNRVIMCIVWLAFIMKVLLMLFLCNNYISHSLLIAVHSSLSG